MHFQQLTAFIMLFYFFSLIKHNILKESKKDVNGIFHFFFNRIVIIIIYTIFNQ